MSSKTQKKCSRCGFSSCVCPQSGSSTTTTIVRPVRTTSSTSSGRTGTDEEVSEVKNVTIVDKKPGSSFFFTESIESVSIDPGETAILTLKNIPTTGNQVIKLDFSDRLEIETFSDSFPFGFSLTYRIVRLNTIACFTLGQDYARTSESNQFYFLTPTLTWTDTPPEGTHTYELRVTLDINSGSFKSAIVHNRTLNAILFPSA